MNKIKVLVVEDEAIIADNICDTLESFGYSV
jgi:CheY-like chemotaxis protein